MDDRVQGAYCGASDDKGGRARGHLKVSRGLAETACD